MISAITKLLLTAAVLMVATAQPWGPPPPFPGGMPPQGFPGGPPRYPGGPGGPPPFPGGPGGPPPFPSGPSSCPPSTDAIETANKAIIRDFYRIAFDQKNVIGAADKYIAKDLIEHNPAGDDTIDGFKKDMTFLTQNSPGQVMDIRRVSADGDLVYVHGKTSWFGQDVAFVDIYRVKDGKIAEHWDVIQNWPVNATNPHPMF